MCEEINVFQSFKKLFNSCNLQYMFVGQLWGNNYGVYFLQYSIYNQIGLMWKVCKNSKARKPTLVCNATNNGTWWLRKIPKFIKRVATRWGLSRQPIDLMDKPNVLTRKASGGAFVIMVLLNWLKKSKCNSKFKYDIIDNNWVDINLLIFIITMNFEKKKEFTSY